jgi:hypothetical protein
LDASAPSKKTTTEVKPTTNNNNVEKESLQKEHEKILKKGIPKGLLYFIHLKMLKKETKRNKFSFSFFNSQLPTPKMIKGLYNRMGENIRLTFKVSFLQRIHLFQEDELWISSNEKTEKYSYLQIRDVSGEPIIGNEDYYIMVKK